VVSLAGGELTHLPDIRYGVQRFLARRLTTGYALKNAAVVTAGSNYQLDLGRAHNVPESKLRLAALGVDTHLFQPVDRSLQSHSHRERFAPPLDQPMIVQAASLLPVKNQHLLLEVLHLAKKEIPRLKLNLAGSGPLQAVLAGLARRLDLEQNLVWRQQMFYPTMVQLYQESHLYLQTSQHESQGMAVLEAMACGLPVLGTPVGVVRDLACLSPQTSAEALAAQVAEIFRDESRYRELRRQARQIVEAKYSLPVTTDNFLKLYDAALNTL
jgi:glycosyltransferase involved in cell wall biosynthesis